MKADPNVIREIERLAKQYAKEAYESTAYTDNYKKSIDQYVSRFVEWTKGNYTMQGLKHPSSRRA